VPWLLRKECRVQLCAGLIDLPWRSLLRGRPFFVRNRTVHDPANVAGRPIHHLGVEIVCPIGVVAVAQNQDSRQEFCHLLEITYRQY